MVTYQRFEELPVRAAETVRSVQPQVEGEIQAVAATKITIKPNAPMREIMSKNRFQVRLQIFLVAVALSWPGPAAWAQFSFGTAISFNGTNQYVDVSNFGSIIPTNEITVEFWAYTTAAAGQSAFMLNPDSGTDRLNAHLNYGSPPGPGLIYWDFGNISTGGRLGPETAPANSIGNWVHYAMVASKSGNYMSIYTNGVLLATESGMTPFVRGTYDLDIGGEPNNTSYHGTIEEFRIWNTALSQAQIQANLGVTLTGSEPNLLVYYRFDSTSGTVATNSATATGSAYNGTVMNGATWISSTVSGAPVLNGVVSSVADSGAGSLRAAIAGAIPGTTITFASALSGDTILLNSELLLNKSLTIDASALANGMTINGNRNGRVFEVASGSTVALTALTVTNGLVSGDGGGILNSGTLTLNRCTVAGNVSTTTRNGGGGVANEAGATLTMSECTVAGNAVAANGGGVENLGALTVNECTFSLNSCTNGGGGIDHFGTSLVLEDTILAGNTASSSPDLDMESTNFSASYCLIGNGSGSSVANGVSGNQAGGPGGPINAMLGPLTNNGGPVATMALLPGSPAMNAGGPLNEVQLVTVGGSAGTFSLSFAGGVTPALAYNAGAAQVQSALNGLSTIAGAGGSVAVTQSGNVYVVSFGGALGGANEPAMTAAAAGGATATVLTLAAGMALPANDERGAGFQRVYGGSVDIGAYELSPDLIATGGGVLGPEGSLLANVTVATFTNRLGPGSVATYSASINWGDGATSAGTVTLSGNLFSVVGSHTYLVDGSYTINTTITNTAATTPAVTATSPATILDVPVVAAGGFFVNGPAGAALPPQTVATFTDPGGAEPVSDYGATITWGDGTAPSSGTIQNIFGNNFSVLGSHLYLVPGHYTIVVAVTHEATPQQPAISTAFIGPATPVLALGSSANPSVFGQAVTFTATVIPPVAGEATPTGAVQFMIDGSPVGTLTTLDLTGKATVQTASLGTGGHEASYLYTGDANYMGGQSSALGQAVLPANTAISVKSSANPALTGQTVSFTATVSAMAPGAGTPTGTVQFVVDGTNAGAPATLNPSGQADLLATLGVEGSPHAVSASYSGSGNFQGSSGGLPGGEVVDCTGIITVLDDNDSGIGSLREAIGDVCPGGTIIFASFLSGTTINLTSGELLLNQSVTIDASGLSGGITINGNQNDRVFEVAGGVTAVLTALTITNGYVDGYGGGIINQGVLTVNQCTVAGNTAAGTAPSGGIGGGLMNLGNQTLTVNECTLAGNAAPDSGGAIFNYVGVLAVNECTVVGNTAGSNVFNGGGGVNNYAGTGTMTNSIVAGNTGILNSNVAGAFASLGNFTSGNPDLAVLGNYGGPTPTMPPLSGSPVVDAGNDAAAGQFATDQRFLPRISGLHVDIGAAELQVTIVGAPETLAGLTWSGSGGFGFSFKNQSGGSFNVLAATNVASPLIQWSNLGSAVESPAGSGHFQFIDPQGTNGGYRFYQVVSP
jgi:hypothetical protein